MKHVREAYNLPLWEMPTGKLKSRIKFRKNSITTVTTEESFAARVSRTAHTDVRTSRPPEIRSGEIDLKIFLLCLLPANVSSCWIICSTSIQVSTRQKLWLAPNNKGWWFSKRMNANSYLWKVSWLKVLTRIYLFLSQKREQQINEWFCLLRFLHILRQ